MYVQLRTQGLLCEPEDLCLKDQGEQRLPTSFAPEVFTTSCLES